jgi:hypothetical protein
MTLHPSSLLSFPVLCRAVGDYPNSHLWAGWMDDDNASIDYHGKGLHGSIVDSYPSVSIRSTGWFVLPRQPPRRTPTRYRGLLGMPSAVR